MKLRKTFVIFSVLIAFVLLLIIYSAKNLTYYPNRKSSIAQDYQENKWLHFDDRLKQLETSLNRHNSAVDEIRAAMLNMQKNPQPSAENSRDPTPPKSAVIHDVLYENTCSFQVNTTPRVNIQMLDVYKQVKFDNPDGGVWKQGWRVEVDEADFNRHNKLKVFVIPHSHNDPGWVKTIEEYYQSQTKRILDNMIAKLPEDPRRKFIWAEISFFVMWWDDAKEEEKEIIRRLVRQNQLEFVTGGWVMNDEASTHWIATIHQLTEGHQWLQRNLNYTPTSHWSIDPFGVGLTQPMILKQAGITNGLIQRIHYSIKKEFSSKKQLEFRWRQLWDSTGKTDFFTHMMPFYSYDIPHTCGPDPKICCQFDFKRLPGHGLNCPWKIAPQAITEKNVAQKAELLLDQYRKKSTLYKTNVLLVPLGDDFRYDHPTEWDVQYENYQKLFDYMNSKLHLNVQAQFGTLTDYFNELHKNRKENDFPVLSGDFFTYADRDDHYWSGYYTSRPFYKRMDRVLLSYIRAAETIHTITRLTGKSKWINSENGLVKELTNARLALSLFQHHDGITGTAKTYVMANYANKMYAGINHCQKVIQQCVHSLLDGAGAENPNPETFHYNIDDVRHSFDSIADRYQITIGVPELRSKKIVIFNPLAFNRIEVVAFHVSTPFVEVVDHEGKRIECQVSPVFTYGTNLSLTKYALVFVANIPALGLASYLVNAVYQSDLPEETKFAKMTIYNYNDEVKTPQGFTVDVQPSASDFTLQNSRITASFNSLGLLKALKTNGNTVPVHMDFVKYGVRTQFHSERSGAYLFLPDGDAISIQIEGTIVDVIEGPIVSSVTVQLPFVLHSVVLYNTPGADGLAIEIINIVDIAKTSNFELAMRLSTNIDSADEYFTDANGYQVVRRRRFAKLPIQANYYPMPTSVYIEDRTTRLTLLTGSPLGCSSLKSGQIEVMMDRRLNQDDNLGLGQPVQDNVPTRHVFRLLLEQKTNQCKTTTDNHPAGFPTLSAHVATQSLLNPFIRLLRNDDDDLMLNNVYTTVRESFSVDFSLVSLRSDIRMRNKEHIGFVLHRQFVDVCYTDEILMQQFPLGGGSVNISSLIPLDSSKKMHKSSLTFLFMRNEVDSRRNLELCPMEMQAYVV